VIDDGGNAVDSAVMAGLMLGVVDGYNSGIGGGCFLLVRASDGTVAAIDGRETAPENSRPAMFYRDGKPDTRLSHFGPLASGVPGALAAYDLALGKYGRKKLGELLERAAVGAKKGFVLDKLYATNIAAASASLAKFPAPPQSS
jgi:gamma-glutamyltranspeptidase / glutathione hydrolase